MARLLKIDKTLEKYGICVRGRDDMLLWIARNGNPLHQDRIDEIVSKETVRQRPGARPNMKKNRAQATTAAAECLLVWFANIEDPDRPGEFLDPAKVENRKRVLKEDPDVDFLVGNISQNSALYEEGRTFEEEDYETWLATEEDIEHCSHPRNDSLNGVDHSRHEEAENLFSGSAGGETAEA